MLCKLITLIALAAMAVAAPNELYMRDARNCRFSMHATEKCRRIPGTGVPTTVTRVTVENILTPSGNPVPGAPDHEINISADPWSLHISSHDEKINGDLWIDAISQDGYKDDKIHFAWDWTNPETNRPETVIWNDGDDGEKTRYGCRFEQPWSKGELHCGNTENPVDERDARMNCFFKCRN